MARWNATKPLSLANPKAGQPGEPRLIDLRYGETIPAKILTESFIGSTLDCLANLSKADVAKLRDWQENNPICASRWDHVLRSPLRLQQLGSAAVDAFSGADIAAPDVVEDDDEE